MTTKNIVAFTEKFIQSNFINEKLVKRLTKKIMTCIISPHDKNKLCQIVTCQYLFWLKMYVTYINDHLHFSTVSALSEDELLYTYENWYKKLKCILPLTPKKLWCIPGYATILFKDKDTYKLECNIYIYIYIYICKSKNCYRSI